MTWLNFFGTYVNLNNVNHIHVNGRVIILSVNGSKIEHDFDSHNAAVFYRESIFRTVGGTVITPPTHNATDGP